MNFKNKFLGEILESAAIYKNGVIDTNKSYQDHLKTYNQEKARELVEKDKRTNEESYRVFVGEVNRLINPRLLKYEVAYAESLSGKSLNEDMALFKYDLDKRDLEILQERHKGNDFFQKQLDRYAITKSIEIPSIRTDNDQIVSNLKSIKNIASNQNLMDNDHFILNSLETALTSIDKML